MSLSCEFSLLLLIKFACLLMKFQKRDERNFIFRSVPELYALRKHENICVSLTIKRRKSDDL